MKRFLPFLILFPSCIGWGDMLAHRERIHDKYFLVEKESGGYGIYYEVGDGGYIGRSPGEANVLAYAIKDSFLIMETEHRDKSRFYYVLNMKKDSMYAEQADCIVDTIDAKQYSSSWLNALSPQYKKVDNHHTHED